MTIVTVVAVYCTIGAVLVMIV